MRQLKIMAKKINTENISFEEINTLDDSKKTTEQVKEAVKEIMKPCFHQSRVQNYFKCPKMYHLSKDHEIETNMAMRRGLIFETMVLGEKPTHDAEYYKKEVIGKITGPTIELLRTQAERAKPFFIAGTPFVKLRKECGKYDMEGEADFIGTCLYEGDEIDAIADLKFTSNIFNIWNKKDSKHQFLQAIFYPQMLYHMTGQLKPFIYTIVEDTFIDPLIKQIKVSCKLEDFDWLDFHLNKIADDLFFEPVTGYHCVGYNGQSKCDFLEWCEEGRQYITEPFDFDFEMLKEPRNEE
jgi:hypothetical protein